VLADAQPPGTLNIPRAAPLANVRLPYMGRWAPPGSGDAGFVHTHSAFPTEHATARVERGGESQAPLLIRQLAYLCFCVHPDSGCTGSMTDQKSRLVNLRPCNERFRAADGKVTTSKCIGDLPVLVTASNGARVVVVFTNVRMA
jgi:hypothetical protein